MSDTDRKRTQVYLRCEVCGKIARPDPDAPSGALPAGWIDLGTSPKHNAARAVCSETCRDLALAG